MAINIIFRSCLNRKLILQLLLSSSSWSLPLTLVWRIWPDIPGYRRETRRNWEKRSWNKFTWPSTSIRLYELNRYICVVKLNN
jgi:hypothetical protein